MLEADMLVQLWVFARSASVAEGRQVRCRNSWPGGSAKICNESSGSAPEWQVRHLHAARRVADLWPALTCFYYIAIVHLTGIWIGRDARGANAWIHAAAPAPPQHLSVACALGRLVRSPPRARVAAYTTPSNLEL